MSTLTCTQVRALPSRQVSQDVWCPFLDYHCCRWSCRAHCRCCCHPQVKQHLSEKIKLLELIKRDSKLLLLSLSLFVGERDLKKILLLWRCNEYCHRVQCEWSCGLIDRLLIYFISQFKFIHWFYTHLNTVKTNKQWLRNAYYSSVPGQNAPTSFIKPRNASISSKSLSMALQAINWI